MHYIDISSIYVLHYKYYRIFDLFKRLGEREHFQETAKNDFFFFISKIFIVYGCGNVDGFWNFFGFFFLKNHPEVRCSDANFVKCQSHKWPWDAKNDVFFLDLIFWYYIWLLFMQAIELELIQMRTIDNTIGLVYLSETREMETSNKQTIVWERKNFFFFWKKRWLINVWDCNYVDCHRIMNKNCRCNKK